MSQANGITGVSVDGNSNAAGGAIALSNNNGLGTVAINLGSGFANVLNLNAYATIHANEIPNAQGDIQMSGTVNLRTDPVGGVGIGYAQTGVVVAPPYTPPPTYEPIMIDVGLVNVFGNVPKTSG